jgi:tetratricopeptide (TPR) repeat protein
MVRSLGTHRIPRVPESSIAPSAGKLHRFEDLNFQIEGPGRPWFEIDAKKMNPDATLAYLRSNPDVCFMIIAERIGGESGVDSEWLIELVTGNLQAQSTECRIRSRRPVTHEGVPGIGLEADATLNGQSLLVVYWIAEHNGFAWQVSTFGERKHASTIREAASSLLARFHPIDTELVARDDDLEPAGDYDAPGFGIEVALAGSGWSRWDTLDEDFPEAVFGARYGNIANFAVLPFPIDPSLPDPDSEALNGALLGSLDMEYPGPVVTSIRPVSQGIANGHELDAARDVNGISAIYKLRVLRYGNQAYLLASWILKEAEARSRILEEVLDRVTIRPVDEGASEPSLTDAQRVGRADVVNRLGTHAYRSKQFEKASAYFRRAIETHPEDPDLLTNYLTASNQMQKHSEALRVLESHIDRFRENLVVRSWLAFLTWKTGDPATACRIYADLFREGYEDENDLVDYVGLLLDAERHDEALTTLESFLERKPSARVRQWVATTHRRKGDLDEATRILRGMLEEDGFQASVAYELAEVFQEAERPTEALAVCEELLAHGVESSYAFLLKGLIELDLKWYRKAKASFERALEIDPNDVQASECLRIASGCLGEGDNSSVKTPIDPVDVPREVAEAVARAREESGTLPEGYAVQYLERTEGVAFETSGARRTTVRLRARILDTGGVRMMSTLQFRFDPLAEEIYVNEVKVIDDQGNPAANGRVDDSYVIDDALSEGASHDKVLHVPVPGLKPGSILEYVVTRKEESRSGGFRFIEHTFSNPVPTGCEAFFVRGDSTRLRHRSTGAVDEIRTPDTIGWICKAPPIYRDEASAAPYQAYLPMLWISDASATWDSVAEEYLGDIADRLVIGDVERTLAASLTEKVETDAEKIAVLANHVQKELVYKAIEFGRRARIPDPASEILSNRYGDCKDHALVLHLLLGAVGIRSRLALVHTRNPIQEEFPSLDQFNHMIVFVPSASETDRKKEDDAPGRFLDCTDKDSDVLATTPFALPSRLAFVLGEENPRFLRIPEYPRDSTSLEIRRSVRLELDGSVGGRPTVDVEETATFTGVWAAWMRGYLRAIDPSERRTSLQENLASRGRIRIRELSIEGLESPAAPLLLRSGYVVEDAFEISADQLVGCLPTPWETSYLEPQVVEDRRSPFEISVPARVESETILHLPDRYRPTSLEAFAHEMSGTFVIGNSAVEPIEDAIRFRLDCRAKTGRFPSERYDEYMRELGKASKALGATLILAKVATPPGENDE